MRRKQLRRFEPGADPRIRPIGQAAEKLRGRPVRISARNRRGQEGNVWVTDGQGKDGKGHQVFKFSPDGRILMTLGKAGVTGDGPDTFNQPSDVAVAPNGDIFVADGHGKDSNARIVKFSKDGRFIKAWGKKGIVPGEFDTPHGLAFDSK